MHRSTKPEFVSVIYFIGMTGAQTQGHFSEFLLPPQTGIVENGTAVLSE